MNDGINIQNLTIFQRHLLDKIWSCETEDDLRGWMLTLPNNVLTEAVTLVHVLQLEFMDQRWDEEGEDLSDTKLYLKKFML